MASFKGQAYYSIDAKGRVAIPARMRNAMNPEANGTFVITRGFERCIFLYPLDRWNEIEDQIRTLDQFRADDRGFVRAIMRWAEEVAMDRQGRVSISRSLLDFARISEAEDDKVLVVGAFDRIEIWNPALFEAYLNEEVGEYEVLAERVMSRGDA